MASAQIQSDAESFLQCLDQWPVYSGYKELNKTRKDIRVLKIWFPPGDQDLHGSLEPVSLGSPPPFEALSYYWGPPDEQRPIIIDGQVVMLTKNLHTFLTMLCTLGQELPVWVDSLCIHQADVEERNHQVSMMGEIYRKAARVQAWIGDPEADSNFALDYVDFLQKGAFSLGARHPQKLRDRLRQAFRVIALRPYWERMWIVQELALASDLLVVSGSRRVRWNCFISAMNHVLGIQTESRIPKNMRDSRAAWHVDRINDLDNIRSSSRSQHLLELTTKFADQLCTDPRDKIYALLGIANQDFGPYGPVDYNRTPLEICFDVLLSALGTILSSGNTASSLGSALGSLSHSAERVLKNLSITLSDFESDFFQGSIRVPVHNLRHSLDFIQSQKKISRSYHLNSVAHLFMPKDEHMSLRTGDLDFRLSPIHSIVVRPNPLKRQYEIVGTLYTGRYYLEDNWCRRRLQSWHLRQGYYGTELCEVPGRTKDGKIDTIYAHVNRAGLFAQIMNLDLAKSRKLFANQNLFPSIPHKSRLCTCKTSNLDTIAGTPDREPILGQLNDRTRELQMYWFDELQPLYGNSIDVSGLLFAFKLKSVCITFITDDGLLGPQDFMHQGYGY